MVPPMHVQGAVLMGCWKSDDGTIERDGNVETGDDEQDEDA
jgi:hypothetical protein